ncbi:MAG: methionine--tRNA ligase [Kiritimatiellia bacterium]
MNPSKYYVTTPIYYVNDKPHIGHAYTTVLGDVLARYHRLFGTPTYFLTGTDEHGQKVQRAAEKAGMTPQQQADTTVVRFHELWHKLGITHDDFIRTTEKRHSAVVQDILQDLFDRGEIYRSEYDGWYCVPCERFFMEKDLTGGTCPDCGRYVEKVREANYFFRMSQYQAWLIRYIEENPKFIQPDFRRNETLGFLRKPLQDLCISRPKSRLAWGIELPFDRDFVCYVWFDALVNYISAVGYRRDPEMFARWWPASCHLIGKDILTTHTVYWPTMLKAMNLPMPETIFAHGWWLMGEAKMGKSMGNAVNPIELADKYGVDAFRYFLMAEMTLGQDASFSEEAFVRRINTDLANDLGNLLSRWVKMVGSFCDGVVPAPAGAEGPDETALKEKALEAIAAMRACLPVMRIDAGLAAIAAALREGNRIIETRQPWSLSKKGDTAALGTVLYGLGDMLRIVSGLLYPVMPGKMREMREVLGVADLEPNPEQLVVWGASRPGARIGAMRSLFPRVEKAAPRPAAVPVAPIAPVRPASAEPVAEGPAGVALIEYADFSRIQLRTARILEASRVEKADKLLRLKIKVGDEERQIVAGIAQHYPPEQLPGRMIVVVANLKPAVVRGVESQGMLLAASVGGVLKLVTVDGDIADGAVVK